MKILTSFKSRKKQKMILEEILIDRANNGKLFHPNKFFVPFYISKDVIWDVVEKNNFKIYDYNFCYRVFNLNSCIHFHKVKIFVFI